MQKALDILPVLSFRECVETSLSTRAAVGWTVDRIRNLSLSERQIGDNSSLAFHHCLSSFSLCLCHSLTKPISTRAAVDWTVDRIRNLSLSERQIGNNSSLAIHHCLSSFSLSASVTH